MDNQAALINALHDTFKMNLMFLTEYDNKLFLRIQNLSKAIELGRYQERYFLEFIESDLEFDIFDSATNSYIYNKQPKRWNTRAVNQINVDANNIINLLAPDEYVKNITDLTHFENPHVFDISNLQTNIDIRQIVEIIPKNITNKHKRFKHINKFIFFGTLLGRHIPKILDKLNTVNHLVCENDLEIFRLSLFVCDYSLLARNGRSVVFSIMENQVNHVHKINMFYYNHLIDTNFFKYHSTNYSVDSYVENFITHIAALDPFLFNYNTHLNTIISRLSANSKLYPTINFSKMKLHHFIFENKPILYLGAGPSLGKNINWVANNQDKFIVVAMGASLKRLSMHDITPDIIVSIDPTKEPIMKQFDIDNKYYKNSIKIVSANTDSDVLCKVDSNNSYLFEVLREILENNKPFSGHSVGETALKVLLSLNTKDIYLLGMDLALDQETGSTHDTSHTEANNKFELTNEFLEKNSIANKKMFSLRGDTIVVKGNMKETVITTRIFEISRKSAEEAAISKKPFQKIYNLSTEGAFIDGTIPADINSIRITSSSLDKQKAMIEIQNQLNLISSSFEEYTKSNNLKSNIEAVKKLIGYLEACPYPASTVDIEQFGKDFFEYFRDTCGVQNGLYEILITHYFTIFRYIQFYFNDKSLKISDEQIKKLSYVWIEQLKRIIGKYLECLNKFYE